MTAEDVINRLFSLGYTFNPDTDTWVLSFLIGKVLSHIKSNINQPDLPDGLHHAAVDMVCGEFLLAKHVSGGLNESSMNTEAAIKSISEGDTSLTFAVADGGAGGESPLTKIIEWLLHGREADFARYRKIAW